jgi:DNA polymerase family A
MSGVTRQPNARPGIGITGRRGISIEDHHMPGTIDRHQVSISGRTFDYQRPWDGQRLELNPAAPYLAFDTETEIVDLDRHVPRMALASYCDGRRRGLIHPDQVGAFILAHAEARYICHKASFDFWVIDHHLLHRDEGEARRIWWDICHQGRLRCSMLLDMLIRLGEGRIEKIRSSDKDYILPRSLAVVAAEYTSLRITKDDPYRECYGEIIGKNWDDEVEEGFFEYAIKDPIVTYRSYLAMMDVAERIMRQHGYDPTASFEGRHSIRPDALKQFGLLAESIQVQAEVVLSDLTRRGMDLDAGAVERLFSDFGHRLEAIYARMQREYPGLICLDRKGNIKRSKKTGAPSINETYLGELLVQAARQVEVERGVTIAVPRTPTGKISKAAKAWVRHAGEHPLFQLWAEREQIGKKSEFFAGLRGGRVHPRYNVMVRTGRTSCSVPNVQNLPRKGGLRELFIPAPGHLLLAVDYSFIELRTLAAVCEARYGFSRLADTIRAGIDPHCYAAALLLGRTLEVFMALAEVEDEVVEDGVVKRVKGYWFKRHRQNAKAINFGVPGGQRAQSLVEYARNTYGVVLTLEQAEAFRTRLIEGIYPELALFLADDTMTILARSLKAGEEECWEAFGRGDERNDRVVRGVENLVGGRTAKFDGTPYNEGWVRRTWESLQDLNRNGDPRLVELLETRQAGGIARAALPPRRRHPHRPRPRQGQPQRVAKYPVPVTGGRRGEARPLGVAPPRDRAARVHPRRDPVPAAGSRRPRGPGRRRGI